MLGKLKTKWFGKEPEKPSETIWDNSSQQYVKDDFKIYWEMLPQVALYQYQCMTGDEKKDYLTYTIEYIREHVGTKDLRGLSIGCGEMTAPEMTLAQTGYFREFEVMDIARKLLMKQDQLARSRGIEGITYATRDLNQVTLEPETYDLIWAVGTIHHVEELESLFDQINLSLKEKGILVMREYVGPNRLQLSDEQLAIVNEILAFLPERYKRMPDGGVKETEKRVSVDELIKVDPSEAVRSEDIIPLLEEKLSILHMAPTGGTILMPLLNGIASNFERDEEGRTILQIIILMERMLMKHHAIPSDYIFCIAGKKS